MSEQIAFLETRYGKIFELDLHGLSKEEARAELVHTIHTIDIFYKAILITHGYHQGRVLKNFIRNEYNDKAISKKINIDASRTLLVIDWEYCETAKR